MRWPPWKRDVLDGGHQALKDAQERLAEVHAQAPEVKRVSDGLREIRRENHFVQKIEDMLRGIT